MSTQVIQKDAFDVIQSAVNKTVNLIRQTYGPAANKVIISKVTHKLVVDDGVQIARDLEFDDEAENAVLNVIRETAIRTNDRVGDGTTSSLIMLQAIIEEVAKRNVRNHHEIEKELKRGMADAKKQLLALAKPITTKDDLIKVARIAFNDPAIADIIASTWFDVGKEGIVTLANSGTMETYADRAEGIKIDRGYISPYMVTNGVSMETIFESPYFLLTDYRLTEMTDVEGIMNKMLAANKQNLVIIADNVEQNALNILVLNQPHVFNQMTKTFGRLSSLAITLPSTDRETFLEDFAILTGARVFTMKKGDNIKDATLMDLGRSERIICRQNESIIVGPRGNKADIKKAVSDLLSSTKVAKTEQEKDIRKKRLAFFQNKVAVIKVGAPTENELNALRYKIDDSVNSVQSAFRDGVVCGAGLALSRIKTSSEILNNALQAPFRQLKDNMGIIDHRELKENEAINAVTGKIGDFMEVGVIDPVEVLIAGIESAVSIASILITTKGLIVEKKKEIKQE